MWEVGHARWEERVRKALDTRTLAEVPLFVFLKLRQSEFVPLKDHEAEKANKPFWQGL